MTDLIKKYDHEKRLAHILMKHYSLITMLMFVAFFSSCMKDDIEPQQLSQSDTYINLSVSAPTASTKAKVTNATDGSTLKDDETSASPDTEDDIHSIRVWAFKTGSGETATPIGYRAETGLNANGTHRVSMKILKQYAEGLEKLDLYILLNAESVNTLVGSDNVMLRRGDLEGAIIENYFGLDGNKAQVTEVPKNGLPISRVIKDINVKENIKKTQAEAASSPISIPLVRAVSKLHFFFARKANSGTEDVEITKIEVNENVIPNSSYLFPTATDNANRDTQGLTGASTGTGYVNSKMTFDGIQTANIKEVEDPTIYVRKADATTGKFTETAQAYMDRLSATIQESHRCYLRETDKPITGKIYYRLGKGDEETYQEFSIPEAYRNHELVIYGYFLNGNKMSIQLEYYVADWNVKEETNIRFN